ncbi:MAG TPA: hypothetical protein VFU47_01585 [Armatimonadota bacterium]|nr:hypothetical protein [Armatimonadota bacterium]
MRRWVWIGGLGLVGVLAVLAGGRPAGAEHFDITLRLRTSKGVAESSWDTSPPEGGLNARQSVTASAGEELYLEWSFRSEFPHGVMKAVRARLFVAPEGEIGQRKLPPAGTPTVLDNDLVASFRPKHLARGHLYFRAPEPGNYLVRLESEETIKEHGHEHFAALDLKVE